MIPCVGGKLIECSSYMHPIGTTFLVSMMRELLEYAMQGYELQDVDKNAICKDIVMRHSYFASSYS